MKVKIMQYVDFIVAFILRKFGKNRLFVDEDTGPRRLVVDVTSYVPGLHVTTLKMISKLFAATKTFLNCDILFSLNFCLPPAWDPLFSTNVFYKVKTFTRSVIFKDFKCLVLLCSNQESDHLHVHVTSHTESKSVTTETSQQRFRVIFGQPFMLCLIETKPLFAQMPHISWKVPVDFGFAEQKNSFVLG